MKHREFLSKLEHESIVQAIRDAEARTSGQIRVFVSHKAAPEALPAAQKQFDRLRMYKTKQRNAVLIFVAPVSQTFAIVGDAGVHAKCGEARWQAIASEMSTHLKAGAFTTAIVHAIRRAGDLLAEHFPPNKDDRNELPDGVIDG